MVQNDRYYDVCPYCGKKREITLRSDDGMDWCGHQRGAYECVTYDDGCNCDLGKLKQKPFEIKHMCLNCKHNDGGCCTNVKLLQTISEIFDAPSKMAIKHLRSTCEHWEFNVNVLKDIVD